MEGIREYKRTDSELQLWSDGMERQFNKRIRMKGWNSLMQYFNEALH